ncbi:hypothetical protein K6Y31_22015, partial [Motilimonas cestriensis]
LKTIDDNGTLTRFDKPDAETLIVTDPNNQRWTYKLDSRGRITTLISPETGGDKGTEGLQRDPRLVQSIVHYQYDEDDNVKKVIDGEGRVTTNVYDDNGNLTQIWQDNALVQTQVYDQNRLIASHVHNGDGSIASAHFVYEGELLRYQVSPAGNVTYHDYDGFGQRISTRVFTGSDALSLTAAMTDDEPLTLAAMDTWRAAQAPKQSTLTEYQYQRGLLHTQTVYATLDEAGKGVTGADTEHVRTTYDAFGNLLSSVRLTGDLLSGELTLHGAKSYVYDGMNRVISQTDNAGITTHSEYLDVENRVVVTTENGLVTSRQFSTRGELLSESRSGVGETTRTLSHFYNDNGQIAATLLPDGSTRFQLYNESGKLWLSVDGRGQVTEYQYNGAGQVTRELSYGTQL